MQKKAPLTLGLGLAGLGSYWLRQRADNRPWWTRSVDDLRHSGRDWAQESGDWLGTAGSRLSDVMGGTSEVISPFVRSGSKQARRTRKRLQDIDLDLDFDGRKLRRQAAGLGESAGEFGAVAGSAAAEWGARAGEAAAEFGLRAGETAAEISARAGEVAAEIAPVVGKLAAETGAAIDEARTQAAGLAGAAAAGLTKMAFRTVRDFAILGLAGAVIVYIYAPEREQQQELLETAQGVAFGAVDFGRGVKQLVDDLRAS